MHTHINAPSSMQYYTYRNTVSYIGNKTGLHVHAVYMYVRTYIRMCIAVYKSI